MYTYNKNALILKLYEVSLPERVYPFPISQLARTFLFSHFGDEEYEISIIIDILTLLNITYSRVCP